MRVGHGIDEQQAAKRVLEFELDGEGLPGQGIFHPEGLQFMARAE
jgi:hypothetical protein